MVVLQDYTPFQRYESQVYIAHNPETPRFPVVGSESLLNLTPKHPIWRRLKHARHSSTCINTPAGDQKEHEKRQFLYKNNIGSSREITGETCWRKTWRATLLPVT
jgi:hypothetical protein